MDDRLPADDPEAVIRFWRMVEMLTPTSFPGRDSGTRTEPVYTLYPEMPMPWQPGHPHHRHQCDPQVPSRVAEDPDSDWAYGVYAGLLNVTRARDDIERWLGRSMDEAVKDEREPEGTSLIGFQVNGEGRVIADSLVVSSFAWSYGRLCGLSQGEGGEAHLELTAARFGGLEGEIGDAFRDALAGTLLDHERLMPFLQWVTERLALPPEALERATCRVQCVRHRRRPEPEGAEDEADDNANAKLTACLEMLNSLFSDDLARLEGKLEERDYGPALAAYLGQAPVEHVDLRQAHEDTWALLDPALFPQGRWPGKGRHPLVFSQQVAVNQAFRQMGGAEQAGLMSVNGPPGTGKTTLLKDVVAGVMVERAKVLAGFARPRDAFARNATAWESGPWRQHYSPLDPRLHDFGMVVASSNNGAVENLSLEFPKAGDVDPEWGRRTSPFVEIASAMLPKGNDAWTLMAARLGNKANRQRFAERFWGSGRRDCPDKGHVRIPAILWAARDGDPPESVLPWGDAVAAFRDAQEREALCRRARRDHYRQATAARDLAERRQWLERERAARGDAVEAAVQRLEICQAAHDEAHRVQAMRWHEEEARAEEALHEAEDRLALAERELAVAEERAEAVQAERAAHGHSAPGWLARACHRLWHVQRVACWEEERQRLQGAVATAKRVVADARVHGQSAQREVRAARQARTEAALREATAETLDVAQHARARLEAAQGRLGDAQRALAEAERTLGACARALQVAEADLEAYARTHGAQHGLRWEDLHLPPAEREIKAPWADAEWEAARVRLFLAALDLHDAFVVAAGQPMINNLQGAIKLLRGQAPQGLEEGIAAHLWASLFLMVPLISTTFASFHRQFAHLGRERLAWLLIDEAGQAPPQYAVGALWRSRRVQVVGDPLQLTPVVTVPDQLQAALARYCGVSYDWRPGFTSVQVLADKASRYGSRIGKTWVGAPLLVHRRCESPMFDISNAVAYEHAMVHAKPAEASALPASAWLHVRAEAAEGHWIEQEGEAVHALIGRLQEEGVERQEIFLITPFRSVIAGYNDQPKALKRKGHEPATIHTVQGKEARVVILVLGGDPRRPGAKEWASQAPNLVNVAVSRAKHRLYVVGDRTLWSEYDYFKECAQYLATTPPVEVATV